MKFLKFIFSTIALISLSLLPSSAIASETAVADSLRSTLAMIKNPSDSLKTLLDIFDSTPQDGKAPVGYEILSIAERLDKQGIIEEFIPQLAILESKNEAKLDNLILEAEKSTTVSNGKECNFSSTSRKRSMKRRIFLKKTSRKSF